MELAIRTIFSLEAQVVQIQHQKVLHYIKCGPDFLKLLIVKLQQAVKLESNRPIDQFLSRSKQAILKAKQTELVEMYSNELEKLNLALDEYDRRALLYRLDRINILSKTTVFLQPLEASLSQQSDKLRLRIKGIAQTLIDTLYPKQIENESDYETNSKSAELAWKIQSLTAKLIGCNYFTNEENDNVTNLFNYINIPDQEYHSHDYLYKDNYTLVIIINLLYLAEALFKSFSNNSYSNQPTIGKGNIDLKPYYAGVLFISNILKTLILSFNQLHPSEFVVLLNLLLRALSTLLKTPLAIKRCSSIEDSNKFWNDSYSDLELAKDLLQYLQIITLTRDKRMYSYSATYQNYNKLKKKGFYQYENRTLLSTYDLPLGCNIVVDIICCCNSTISCMVELGKSPNIDMNEKNLDEKSSISTTNAVSVISSIKTSNLSKSMASNLLAKSKRAKNNLSTNDDNENTINSKKIITNDCIKTTIYGENYTFDGFKFNNQELYNATRNLIIASTILCSCSMVYYTHLLGYSTISTITNHSVLKDKYGIPKLDKKTNEFVAEKKTEITKLNVYAIGDTRMTLAADEEVITALRLASATFSAGIITPGVVEILTTSKALCKSRQISHAIMSVWIEALIAAALCIISSVPVDNDEHFDDEANASFLEDSKFSNFSCILNKKSSKSFLDHSQMESESKKVSYIEEEWQETIPDPPMDALFNLLKNIMYDISDVMSIHRLSLTIQATGMLLSRLLFSEPFMTKLDVEKFLAKSSAADDSDDEEEEDDDDDDDDVDTEPKVRDANGKMIKPLNEAQKFALWHFKETKESLEKGMITPFKIRSFLNTLEFTCENHLQSAEVLEQFLLVLHKLLLLSIPCKVTIMDSKLKKSLQRILDLQKDNLYVIALAELCMENLQDW